MARINLLPWREELRKEKQKEFLTMLGLVALLGVVLMGISHLVMSGFIASQQERNMRLEKEIRLVNRRIKEIEELERVKQALVDRMDIIQQLQRSRPEIVHLFDELVTTLPEGLYLTELEQKSSKLNIQGKAESDARISSYMRNLEASPWLQNPVLTVIQTRKEKSNSNDKKTMPANVRDFSLNVTKTGTKDSDPDKEKNDGSQ